MWQKIRLWDLGGCRSRLSRSLPPQFRDVGCRGEGLGMLGFGASGGLGQSKGFWGLFGFRG